MTIYLYNPYKLRSEWRSYLNLQKNETNEIILSGTPNSSEVSFKWEAIPIPKTFCSPEVKKLGIRKMEIIDEKSLLINDKYKRKIALIVPVNNMSEVHPSNTLVTISESKSNDYSKMDRVVLALYEHWWGFLDLYFSSVFHPICTFDNYQPESKLKSTLNITSIIGDMPEKEVLCKETWIDDERKVTKTYYFPGKTIVSDASLAIHMRGYIEREIGNKTKLSEREETEFDQKISQSQEKQHKAQNSIKRITFDQWKHQIWIDSIRRRQLGALPREKLYAEITRIVKYKQMLEKQSTIHEYCARQERLGSA
jgi:hypothetical protein